MIEVNAVVMVSRGAFLRIGKVSTHNYGKALQPELVYWSFRDKAITVAEKTPFRGKYIVMVMLPVYTIDSAT